MKILFTICGRAGSKGIKNKNIRNFLGKPLPYYTLSVIDLYLKKYKETVCDIVLNTDSENLMKLFLDNGMREVEIIERDPILAGDMTAKIDVISNCMSIMQERKGTKYDVIIDLDITAPLRKVKDIENLIKVYSERKPDVVTSVVPARRNPFFNQLVKSEDGYKKVIDSNYTARQQAPEIYDMNASLYAYSPEYLKLGKGVLDGYCEVIEMQDTGILDLDHENDFKLMEIIGKHLFEHDTEFADIKNNLK